VKIKRNSTSNSKIIMTKMVGTLMRDLNLITLCQGMVAIKNNAVELLDDAKLLRANGRLARAYATAYMACEENGKISILQGAAVQIILGRPLDWKSIGKRFRSHDSKASQFMAIANAIPILESAIKKRKANVALELVLAKATVGVTEGPKLFQKRNASMYCDFINGVFQRPSDVITGDVVDAMIVVAEANIRVATLLASESAEEIAKRLTESSSPERHDFLMSSMHNFLNKLHPDPIPENEDK